MATNYLIINTGRTNKDGRSPINLRICDRSKVKTFATGFSALPGTRDKNGEWNNDGEWDHISHRFRQGKGVKRFFVQCREEGGIKEYTNIQANDELGNILKKAKSILSKYDENGVDWTMNMFESDFKHKRIDNNFIEYARSRVKTYQKNGQWNTASILESAISDLEDYDKRVTKMDIKDIDKAFIQGYIASRIQRDKPNTISIRLRAVRSVLKYAITDKVGSRSTYPFGGKENDGVKIPEERETKITNYIPTVWLQKLAATPMDNPTLEESRHLFLFLFFCGGLNYADGAKLTSKNLQWIVMEDGTMTQTINYVRSKTHKQITVYVTENIKKELDWFRDNCSLVGDHLLPIINGKDPAEDKWTEYVHQRRKRFNRYIKRVAKALEFPEALQDLGSYTARHSFAMALRHKGVADGVITAALGHEDPRTTRNYFDRYGNVESKKAQTIDITVTNKD